MRSMVSWMAMTSSTLISDNPVTNLFSGAGQLGKYALVAIGVLVVGAILLKVVQEIAGDDEDPRARYYRERGERDEELRDELRDRDEDW